MIRSDTTVFCLLALLGLAPSDAFACRCAGPISPRPAYRRADVVGAARILTVIPNPGNNGGMATVRVSRAWKRAVHSELTVATDSTCAYELTRGREELLYLSRTSSGGYGTSKCDGNQRLSKAKDALDWLKRHGRPANIRP